MTWPGNRTDGGRSYNAANQVNGWSYDAVGNVLTGDGNTYTYDALSRQTGRNATTYAYNGDGALVRETLGIRWLSAPTLADAGAKSPSGGAGRLSGGLAAGPLADDHR